MLKYFITVMFAISIVSCTRSAATLGLDGNLVTGAQDVRVRDPILHFQKNTVTYDFKRLDDSSAETARNFFKINISSLHRPQTAPYPAPISQVIDCDPATKPEPLSFSNADVEFDGYKIFADHHGTFTACEKDRAVNGAFWGFMKCKNKPVLYEVKAFYPNTFSSLQSELLALRCL